ncbi:ATP-binding cassette domain-containing protein [Enterococcus sp. CSURQ0835]|uniref:ATP-binding cassette domain-containing protein n=1 Tax=Enterococcus sp. CSURQ0835 TaxID=2681394 RepID=UPI0013579185|nr:ABC transporter ATP-binding protein [Enterococcus sp. CSURQ0835]
MSLELKHISKAYHNKPVLQTIDWQIEAGKIYGLLGRNGAGKSTLLNIINNRSFQTAGTLLLDGQPVHDNEQSLNRLYMMSEDNLYPGSLKVKSCFQLTEAFYGDFDEALAKKMVAAFGLDTKQDLRKLSTGYRTIAKLIMALCVPCDYIFLDEPVLGLDANHRELFYQFILETYETRPRTFVISTHLIEEVANLLEEVVIIRNGRLIRQATTEEIQQEGKVITGPKAEVEAFIAQNQLTVLGKDELGGLLNVYVKGDVNGEVPATIHVGPLDLQTYFVQLTNQEVA